MENPIVAQLMNIFNKSEGLLLSSQKPFVDRVQNQMIVVHIITVQGYS